MQPLHFGQIRLADLEALPYSAIGRLCRSAVLSSHSCLGLGLPQRPYGCHPCVFAECTLRVFKAVDKMAIQELIVRNELDTWDTLYKHLLEPGLRTCDVDPDEWCDEPEDALVQSNLVELLRSTGFQAKNVSKWTFERIAPRYILPFLSLSPANINTVAFCLNALGLYSDEQESTARHWSFLCAHIATGCPALKTFDFGGGETDEIFSPLPKELVDFSSFTPPPLTSLSISGDDLGPLGASFITRFASSLLHLNIAVTSLVGYGTHLDLPLLVDLRIEAGSYLHVLYLVYNLDPPRLRRLHLNPCGSFKPSLDQEGRGEEALLADFVLGRLPLLRLVVLEGTVAWPPALLSDLDTAFSALPHSPLIILERRWPLEARNLASGRHDLDFAADAAAKLFGWAAKRLEEARERGDREAVERLVEAAGSLEDVREYERE